MTTKNKQQRQKQVLRSAQDDNSVGVMEVGAEASLGPERLVAVDWSGRVDVAGQRRHIWAGVWTRGVDGKERVELEAGRTREEMGEWLVELAAETPRMVVSVDCCFSYPAWFLREHGCATVFEFWEKAAAGYAERWLARETEGVERDERFWGKPHRRPEVFCGEGFPLMFRLTEWDNKVAQGLEGGDADRAAKMKGITPKSPFQIGGAGSVGTVWPFEDAELGGAVAEGKATALNAKVAKGAKVREGERVVAKPLLVEMYTRLMTGAVAKSNEGARAAYLKARRKNDAVWAEVSRGVMAKAMGSEDAFDALVSTMEMVRYAQEFAGLKATTDEVLKLEGITWRPGVIG